MRGLGVGLIAVGLILAFRSGGALNLAHGQIGAFSAVAMLILVRRWELPYWAAFPFALAVGALLSALVYVTIVRRLRDRPAALTLLVTMGAGQLLLVAGGALAQETDAVSLFPQPPGVPETTVGTLLVTPAIVTLAVLGPLAVAALWTALARTHLGRGVRAAGDDEDTARLTGLRATRLSAVAWAAAGALAALTAMLVLPAGGSPTAPAFGLDLLMRALAAAVLAGMRNMPGALAAGVALGAGEEALHHHVGQPEVADAVLVVVIAAALLWQRAPRGRPLPAGAWSLAERWPAIPAAARAVPLVRLAPGAAGLLLVASAALLPLVAGAGDLVRLSTVAAFAVLGLSVWVLLGVGGMLSLGQVAFAAVGALAAHRIADATGSAALGLLAAPAAGGAACALLAIPALRSGPFGLTVLSLAWAFATPWLVTRDWAFGEGTDIDPVVLGPVDSSDPAGAYWLSLAVLALATMAVSAVARSGWARRIVAVRDNVPAARALGIVPGAARLDALLAAGALAGLAGALLAHTVGRVTPESFPPNAGLTAAAMALIGGLAIAGGPLLGSLYMVALPAFVPLDGAALAATALGWLLLLLYLPGGIAAGLEPLRRRTIELLLRAAGQPPDLAAPPPRTHAAGAERAAEVAPAAPRAESPEPADGPPVIELDDVTRFYGALRVLDGVSLKLQAREILAVLGPNGAGKTTLLDVASGFVAPDRGRVFLAGADVTRLTVERRALRGLARSFQDAALFPTLTVAEALAVAARDEPRRATTALELFGLEGHADARVRTLSTGLRRLADLACVVARGPRVVLLDEPAAGLTAAEAEALAALLLRLRDELGLAILLVEHQLAVVSSVADRALVLVEGRVAAAGSPTEAVGRVRAYEEAALTMPTPTPGAGR